MTARLYPFNSRSVPDARPQVLQSKSAMNCVYANIIVDIQVRDLKDRLFTYRVPEELTHDTFIGAQVLVPFGSNNLVGGYVISLTDRVASETGIKDIADVLEPEPLFDREYIDFLYWIAEYYCASISDVIAAAIPASLAPKIKRYVKLTERARASQNVRSTLPGDPAMMHMLSVLNEAKTGALSIVALRQRWRKAARLPQSHFYRALNFLKQEELVEVESQTTETQAPKTQTVVVWTGNEAETARQKQVVSVLTRAGGQMFQKELLEEAKTTTATLKRL